MRTYFLTIAMSVTIFATGVTEAIRYCIQGDDFPGGAGDQGKCGLAETFHFYFKR